MTHLLLALLFFANPQSGQLVIPEEEILKLSPDMIAWVESVAPQNASPELKLTNLVNGIFNPKNLNLTYENYRTKTAAETFYERKGNCLSLTLMFVALAKHVGLYADFQEVNTAPTWDRRQGVIMQNRHINSVIRIYNREHVVDFNPDSEHKETHVVKVSLERTLSQFYNNRGAEQFAQRNYDAALAHFEKALSLSPQLSYAWTNLGVLRTQQNDFKGAETAYLTAIRYNNAESAAMSNLVRLYLRWDKPEKAQYYERKVNRYRKANPYYHFGLGNDAFAAGSYEAAIQHYKAAIRRKPKTHEFYFSLAKAYSALGNPQQVTHYLERAREFAPDVFNRDRYSQKLEKMAKR